MIKIMVLIVGLALITFIAWWFFGKHATASEASEVVGNHQTVAVEVNGGYAPETVELTAGVPATLNFTRRDASGCLDHVVFNDFGINQALPKDQTEAIDIDTSKPGTYQWACGMDMFHGKLIIK
ncbi:cupredoxin domain-containing protein [Lactobacillus sp. Sy-1]|uniref:cupredoxin domain-containing protein n=1 Tax=Lactobacillus sp. Sy-1 TaxID=2109645 RepID=UPI001C5BDFE5|nr:cupredoxin domain-containing protein [Lactobacillus sp. Sy-1]MBW1606424.1 cupredoxin domain-containing protein [Lactobacillus sp. Sy-1]